MTTLVVVFEDCWVTDPTEPEISVHASYPDRGHAAGVDGEVRTYAGGRRRVITSARKSATYPVTLQLLSDAEVEQLKVWRGRVLLLRDGEGLRVWGSYMALDVTSYWDPEGPVSDVSLTFTAVDHDESV